MAINFIGEGGTSTGDFHEGLNLAGVREVGRCFQRELEVLGFDARWIA